MTKSPFQFGRERLDVRSEKRYYPYISRFGQRRYAGRGRFYFRTATRVENYARRWAERAEKFLKVEAKHADQN